MTKYKKLDILLSIPITWSNIEAIFNALPRRSRVRYALFCAKQLAHLNTANEVVTGINLVEQWLNRSVDDTTCYQYATNILHKFIIENGYLDGGNAYHEGNLAIAHPLLIIAYAQYEVYYALKNTKYKPNYCKRGHLAYIENVFDDIDNMRQERLSYIRELIIELMPEDMKDNWLLIASL